VAGLKAFLLKICWLSWPPARKSAALVRRLSPEDLVKTDRHPWLGIATIGDILNDVSPQPDPPKGYPQVDWSQRA
jgi:hypothetical protein